MPRNPKGEMSLTEIRNLARQHNKLSTIKGIDTASRASLIKQIQDMGYEINHEKKMIKKKRLSSTDRLRSKVKVGSGGERKPNIVTKKKVERERIKKTEPSKPAKRKLKGRLTGVQKATDAKAQRRKDLIAGNKMY